MTTTPATPADQIIACAARFAGLHETIANRKWDAPDTPGTDPESQELAAMMQACGWQPGWPYCAAFVEAVWREVYKDAPKPLRDLIARRLTPSVMQSFNNWRGEVSRIPRPGAIFFMQNGGGSTGHAGIVVRAGANSIATIEANTSPAPNTPEADREGDGIFRKTRRLDFTQRSSGLWLRGFLNPPGFDFAG